MLCDVCEEGNCRFFAESTLSEMTRILRYAQDDK
jgi:hypothetical protein